MLPISNAHALREALLDDRTATTNKAQLTGSDPGIFGDMIHAATRQIQAADTKAQQAVSGLLSGQGVEVHEAMIATQQADLTFELALQVRNKAVAAYQQMMQMQF